MLNDTECWQAVLARDAGQDGRFFFGVTTTGVYCRPSCAARRPLRKNVRFYASTTDAERDGLRACRRCRPGEAGKVERMQALCEHIRQSCDSGEPLTLEVLAGQAGLSPSHLQRTFREVVGMTPRQYVESCRLDALRSRLRDTASVTDAIYEAGFGSSSRVYEKADRHLGMTPREYRSGGKGLAISYVSFDSPVGLLLVAATDRGLCSVQFGDSAEELVARLRQEYPAAAIEPAPASSQLEPWVEALARHLRGEQPHLDLPLAVRASAFQQRVWSYLQSIPYGEVRSYAEVATAVGRPTAVRAVARACASNRTALAIPCHRVIRGNGELGGYRWGEERKRRLLDRERAAAS